MNHPEITTFVARYKQAAMKKGSYRAELGYAEIRFLEKVLGPLLHYRFDGLEPEFPFIDAKSGDRFIDFVYVRGGLRLVMEVDGYRTHARNISRGDFDDHLARQNDLVLAGWIVLRFSADMIEKQPEQCQRQIAQAIGLWWSHTQSRAPGTGGSGLWSSRRELVRAICQGRGGQVTTRDLMPWLQLEPALGASLAAALRARRLASSREGREENRRL